MTQSVKGGFLRDDTTGALAVTGSGGGAPSPVTLFRWAGIDNQSAGGFYDPLPDGGLTVAVTNEGSKLVVAHFELNASNLAVTGFTTRLRARIAVFRNNVDPTITHSIRVYGPNSFSGATTALDVTDGTQVLVATAPNTGADTDNAAQADAALPGDGAYRVYVIHSGGCSGRQLLILTVEAYYV